MTPASPSNIAPQRHNAPDGYTDTLNAQGPSGGQIWPVWVELDWMGIGDPQRRLSYRTACPDCTALPRYSYDDREMHGSTERPLRVVITSPITAACKCYRCTRTREWKEVMA